MKAILLTLGMIMLCGADDHIIFPIIGVALFAVVLWLDSEPVKEDEKKSKPAILQSLKARITGRR